MTIHIGILGAARIASMALVQPAQEVSDVTVTAIAARDGVRAQQFAKRHGIPNWHDSYEALIADPNIHAIYNPLPNGLHGRWTMAALEAGKHVLCEKPFTANAEEAEQVAAVARRTGLVTMEAFHYRYHALTQRMLEIIASGELGTIRHSRAWFHIPLFLGKDIRWDHRLAGGAMMDTGCYAVHLLRTLAGAEPVVHSASAKMRGPDVDRCLQARMEFADGRTAELSASMWSRRVFGIGAQVVGSTGTMTISNPFLPQFFHKLTVKSATGRRVERVNKQPSTYVAQLQAFAAAILRGEPFPTNVDDAIANMKVIDACYIAAGLSPRQPSRYK